MVLVVASQALHSFAVIIALRGTRALSSNFLRGKVPCTEFCVGREQYGTIPPRRVGSAIVCELRSIFNEWRRKNTRAKLAPRAVGARAADARDGVIEREFERVERGLQLGRVRSSIRFDGAPGVEKHSCQEDESVQQRGSAIWHTCAL